jgi:Cu-Zn family superoxide dismutase
MNRIAPATLVLMLAVATLRTHGQDNAGKRAPPQKAVAVMAPTSGSKVTGVVTFTARDGYVEISGDVRGLTPGLHGFHIHEFGDISALDGGSAGGHFNPTDMPHAGPDAPKRHVGDLGNIKADASGKATLQIHDKLIALHGPNSVIGRALVIHAQPDDLKSQPSGEAGERVACGVIGLANPKPAPLK